jgi:hypothetical protein
MLDLLRIRERRLFFDDLSSVRGSYRNGRFTCPCCGYPTLSGRASYEICKLCWWEDDGHDDDNADEVLGGPNKDYSLNDARVNFQMFGVKLAPGDNPGIDELESGIVRTIKTRLITVFDSMMKEFSAERRREMWKEVLSLEQQLKKEQKKAMQQN